MVCFCHFVAEAHIVFVFHHLHRKLMIFIGVFCFKGGKGNSAAAYDAFTACGNDVSADWADIKLESAHVEGTVHISHVLPC